MGTATGTWYACGLKPSSHRIRSNSFFFYIFVVYKHIHMSPGEFYAIMQSEGLMAALEGIGLSWWIFLIPVVLIVGVVLLAAFVDAPTGE